MDSDGTEVQSAKRTQRIHHAQPRLKVTAGKPIRTSSLCAFVE